MTSGRARPLSLSAGSLRGVRADRTVEVAAAAGYDGAGVRPLDDELGAAPTARVRRAADAAGIWVLDVEVVRIGRSTTDQVERLVDFAGAVGARHVLAVSVDDDHSRAAAALADLSARCEAVGVTAVLEFMAFTAVPDLPAALDLVHACGQPVGVLVDALHLQRSGGTPADLCAAGPFPYLQLCDAGRQPPEDGDLAGEARGRRLPPGEGDLPVAELLAALPAIPASVEVQSELAWATVGDHEWAVRLRRSADAVLGAGVVPG